MQERRTTFSLKLAYLSVKEDIQFQDWPHSKIHCIDDKVSYQKTQINFALLLRHNEVVYTHIKNIIYS